MRRTFLFHREVPNLLISLAIQIIGPFLLWLLYLPIPNQTHAASSITQTTGPGNLGTIVTPNSNVYGITEGTPVGNNVFHSFTQFNVGAGDIAQFQTTTLLPNTSIHNILGRVTGQNPSSIFGTIDSASYYPGANLFLMNPNGIIFGPTATLNVGGMATFTTANYLRLTDTGIFHADPAATSVLTSAPVTAFGFLGSNPAAISVQGTTLETQPGQSISFVGGNQGFTYMDPGTGSTVSVPNGVTITGGTLSAQNGQVNIASVASPGEVMAGTLEYAPNVNRQSFEALGTIQVSQQSSIDVSGNGGGTVLIRGGQFYLDNSTITAGVKGSGPVTNGVESIGRGIDIVVSQDAAIQNFAVLETSVDGNATPGVTYGGVHVKAGLSIEIQGASTGILSDISPGSTGGNSGAITLEANSILINLGQLQTFTEGVGNAGNIIATARHDLEIDAGTILSGSQSDVHFATGDTGSIQLASAQGNISLKNLTTISSQTTAGSPGAVGIIALSAPIGNIYLADSKLSTLISPPLNLGVPAVRAGGSGGILINAKNLELNGGDIGIVNLSNLPPGNLTVNLSDSLGLHGGSTPKTLRSSIHALSQGPASSAGLTITAHDILVTDAGSLTTSTVSFGAAGPLSISAVNLQLTNGGQISSESVVGIDPFTGLPSGPPPVGPAGTVTIQGTSGPAQSVLIDGQGSGILTNTVGIGPGGTTNLAARSLTIQNGGTISASTSGTATSATGGSITVNTTDQVTMTDHASITASSKGLANAGDISINAGQQFEMRNSSITTTATKASGGNIDVQAVDRVRLVNSPISTSVHSGAGGGGNITIDPNVVVLLSSPITAQADRGAGGNITITTPLFLSDFSSPLKASSERGVNGTVTIQSPNAPISGHIQPLGASPLLATSLLNQRCASLAGGEFSSFTVAGRDSLPTEPGSWLASPLATLSAGTELGAKSEVESSVARGEGREGMTLGASLAGERTLLSLRQIVPDGFLTQAFAVDWSAGCRS